MAHALSVPACALVLMVTTSAWADCTLPWKSTPKAGQQIDTANPGYFDAGAGFGYISSANAERQAASGVLVIIKAYPCGRWYAPPKKASASDLTDKLKEAVKKTAESGGDPNKQGAADKAAEDYATTLSNYVKNQSDLYELAGSHWYHRFSAYYGRSVGDFDKTTIKGRVDTLGVAYDVAPEFAITAGVAFYQINLPSGGFDTRRRFMLGVQMNFNAFSAFRNLGGGGN